MKIGTNRVLNCDFVRCYITENYESLGPNLIFTVKNGIIIIIIIIIII